MTDLSDRVKPGATIAVRATPEASHARIDASADPIRVYVTAPPEDGKANKAVQKFLAKALGVPQSRLELVQGHMSRDKVFRIL